ncbi:hypothetical protein Lser_V15G43649 [Lactuca serriola]
MMSTTAIGLRATNSLLGSSYFYSDTTEKFSCNGDISFTFVTTKNTITAKKQSNYSHSLTSKRDTDSHSIRALKQHVATSSDPSISTDQWVQRFHHLEDKSSEQELPVEALLLLQSFLEKQWKLPTEKNTNTTTDTPTEKNSKKIHIISSQISARKRRIEARKKTPNSCSEIGSELLQNQFKGHVKGVRSEGLLTQSEVIILSKKIKIGLRLEEQKSRLKEKLGYEPSEGQLASSMRISRMDLRKKQIESTLAREKLAMSNVRLVMSIAKRYDNMGAQMADLIQGGLIGLLQGIKKYDSSRGFKISTYVYWWIRQGVSRALIENSKILRLPTHLHERQSAIRNAKAKLEEQGITPSIDRITESLNISRKKVINATQAITKVFSLDNPGQTLDSDIADNCMENDPWHGVDEAALKYEVNKLINMTLGERERDIIRLYYGLDNECLYWEDIGKRIGLSRERVRQIGLVALEKLKHGARKNGLEEMLVKH